MASRPSALPRRAKRALLVAVDQEDRMGDQTDDQPLVLYLSQHGVQEKGHVVVDDFDDRQAAGGRFRRPAA